MFVVAALLFNRASESRTTKRPVMADLRDSGALEQDADLIFSFHLDQKFMKTPETAGLAEIIVAKHRNGETWKEEIAFCCGMMCKIR